ncbi:MAG: hypothetical protein AAGJ81_04965 [Verrucomicrobiota bacterium]
MKSLWLVLLFALFVTGCSSDPENASVKQAFEDYKSAILNDDAETAYGLVNENTKAWYGETLDRVLTSNRDQIMELGVLDKIQVILIRHRVPREEILQMTPESLFKYAASRGWVGKNSVSGLGIGKIDVQRDFATGVVRTNGEDSPIRFHFYKEDGVWRIDLTELNKWGEAALITQIKQSRQDELDYIFTLVQFASGKPVQESIWKPLIE